MCTQEENLPLKSTFYLWHLRNLHCHTGKERHYFPHFMHMKIETKGGYCGMLMLHRRRYWVLGHKHWIPVSAYGSSPPQIANQARIAVKAGLQFFSISLNTVSVEGINDNLWITFQKQLTDQGDTNFKSRQMWIWRSSGQVVCAIFGLRAPMYSQTLASKPGILPTPSIIMPHQSYSETPGLGVCTWAG